MIQQPKPLTWKPAHTSNFRVGRALNPINAHEPFKPQLIVVHVMDGSLFGTTTEFQMQLPKGKAKSSHYGIGWDWPDRAKVGLSIPQIFQFVKDKDTAFHAGTVGKAPASAMVRNIRSNYPNAGFTANDYSIGIECHGTGSVWHKNLTPVLVHLIAWLCQHHGLKANRETIVGHYEIDAERRANCPGKNCNLLKIVDDVQYMLAQDALQQAKPSDLQIS